MSLEVPELPTTSTYTSCYCEENIYLLCDRFLQDEHLTQNWDVYVTFISNANKTVSPYTVSGGTLQNNTGNRWLCGSRRLQDRWVMLLYGITMLCLSSDGAKPRTQRRRDRINSPNLRFGCMILIPV